MKVLDRRPWYGQGYAPLWELVHVQTGEQVEDTETARAELTSEHLAAYVGVDVEEVWLDGTGQQVDETLIDWSLMEDDDPTATPEDGKLDPRTLTESETVTTSVEWFHTSPADDGLETGNQRWRRERDADTVLAAATEAGAVNEAGEIDHDALAAAQKAKESAERRQVKALNKLGLAAQEVRREHLRTALARKTLPKGCGAVVARFVATTMWSRHGLFGLNLSLIHI